MNMQKVRLANTQHILQMQRGGARVFEGKYKVGEHLKLTRDCDLSVDEGVLSVPAGSIAVVKECDQMNLTLDLGSALGGKYVLPVQEVSKYFEKHSVKESLDEVVRLYHHGGTSEGTDKQYSPVRKTGYQAHSPEKKSSCPGCGATIKGFGWRGGDQCKACATKGLDPSKSDKLTKESIGESNPTVATPFRRVRVARYDPNIGTNRGPKSPGLGGYEVLVGQEGEVTSIYGQINGIKTYRVNLVQGGQFIFGETELVPLGESTVKKPVKKLDESALMGVGYGMV